MAREALGAHLKLAQQVLTGAADRATAAAVAALPQGQHSRGGSASLATAAEVPPLDSTCCSEKT